MPVGHKDNLGLVINWLILKMQSTFMNITPIIVYDSAFHGNLLVVHCLLLSLPFQTVVFNVAPHEKDPSTKIFWQQQHSPQNVHVHCGRKGHGLADER
jgi:hypothetical protein